MSASMCFYVFILFLIAAIGDGKKSRELLLHRQQVGDKWYWGYADDLTSSNNIITSQQKIEPTPEIPAVERRTASANESSTEAPTNDIPSFCLPSFKPPEMPEFSKPGRRISEQKCYEYIWQLNNRIAKNERKAIYCQIVYGQCVRRLKNTTKTNFGESWVTVEFKLLQDGYISKKYEKLPPNKVVGGKPVPPGIFPHMGAIGWKAAAGTWVFKCGGSLISEKFVLTAAHCSKASPKDSSIADIVPKIVRIGDRTLLDHANFVSNLRNVDKEISKIIVHPQYKAPIQYYDIALLELKDPVIFTAVAQPACLWSTFDTSSLGSHANVTGWGVVRSGSLRISPDLLVAEIDLLDLEKCNGLLKLARNRNWDGFEEHQICAGKLEGGVDACQGDSGGPLQVKMPLPKNATDAEGCMHYVIGIISFGIQCGLLNLPGVYTRVSSFIDWIEDNVWKNNE